MPAQEDYQKFMQQGQDAAWSLNWQAAAENFTRAVQISSEDANAHISLGLALLNLDQLDRALRVYRKAIQLAPKDPEPLERSAVTLERMGQLREAAQQYIKVSELYIEMRDLDKAISTWEHATQLTPGLVAVHARLAQAYERIGDKPKAIREYLVLAYNFRRLNDVEKAIKSVERALRIDPKNALALNTLRALQSGGEVILPSDLINRKIPVQDVAMEAEFTGDLFWSPDFIPAVVATESGSAMGPMGEAMNNALEILAQHVLEVGLDGAAASAMRAMEDQRQGSHDLAINGYLEADAAGLRHPALKLNLGALLLLEERGAEAVKHLGETLTNKALTSGGLHALGLAYQQIGDLKKAARFLVQAAHNVTEEIEPDLERRSEAQNVYSTLTTVIQDASAEALTEVINQFVNALSGTDWRTHTRETSSHLAETLRRDGSRGLIDILTTSSGDTDLPETISTIDKYVRKNLLTLAMDEAHRAMETAPYYLPVHVRMAEILMKEGRMRQGINKYNMIAKAYMVRDENDRAATILTDVLKIAPLDIEVRTNLIQLLETQGRYSDALNQYTDLANTYQQLGDFDRSSQTFGSAERLARRIDAPATKVAEIKHFIADIHQMRLNTRQAQKTYEEILAIVPDDERALRALVDTYYSQGNQVEAIKRLDILLTIYVKKGTINRVTGLLEDLVRTYQRDMPARSRLASIYRKLGDNRKAIEQLDALGELQLDAGLHKEAATTIRQIIAMKPERVDEYKKLLSQLE